MRPVNVLGKSSTPDNFARLKSRHLSIKKHCSLLCKNIGLRITLNIWIASLLVLPTSVHKFVSFIPSSYTLLWLVQIKSFSVSLQSYTEVCVLYFVQISMSFFPQGEGNETFLIWTPCHQRPINQAPPRSAPSWLAPRVEAPYYPSSSSFCLMLLVPLVALLPLWSASLGEAGDVSLPRLTHRSTTVLQQKLRSYFVYDTEAILYTSPNHVLIVLCRTFINNEVLNWSKAQSI